MAPFEPQRPRGAAFLDRDGVLNIDTGFAHRPDQMQWVDGAVAAVQRLNRAGLFVFVVTNQSGIGRGYYTEDHVRDLHGWMAGQFRSQGAVIDDFSYCPHYPEASVAAYRTICQCRKPGPGMIVELMKKWPVRPDSSFMVGDRESDVGAARAAGIRGHLFSGGNLDSFIAGILAQSDSRTP